MNYYNEIDPYAAQWLRNLIDAGHIAPGDVDERSIADVRADDLAGYTQCHFFAGIGGWSLALRLAGWPDDRPVWTGSCPCQPFSAAGAGKAANDERHLWPAWFPLIAQRRPPVVFGEQVEAAVGWGWLDAVFADLEGEGYACGAAVLPACGVGAPHIRQRTWFVADALRGRAADTPGAGVRAEAASIGEHGRLSRGSGGARVNSAARKLVDAAGEQVGLPRRARKSGDAAGKLGDACGQGLQERERDGRLQQETMEPSKGQAAIGASNPWDCDWIPCTDGKARPVRPGSSPLAHGVQHRASKLRAYGNAIVPQVAAEFIKAACD